MSGMSKEARELVVVAKSILSESEIEKQVKRFPGVKEIDWDEDYQMVRDRGEPIITIMRKMMDHGYDSTSFGIWYQINEKYAKDEYGLDIDRRKKDFFIGNLRLKNLSVRIKRSETKEAVRALASLWKKATRQASSKAKKADMLLSKISESEQKPVVFESEIDLKKVIKGAGGDVKDSWVIGDGWDIIPNNIGWTISLRELLSPSEGKWWESKSYDILPQTSARRVVNIVKRSEKELRDFWKSRGR